MLTADLIVELLGWPDHKVADLFSADMKLSLHLNKYKPVS